MIESKLKAKNATVDSCLLLHSCLSVGLSLYHVVVAFSFLRSISLASLLFYFYCWLIRSFTDPTYANSFCVCGPLPHLY